MFNYNFADWSSEKKNVMGPWLELQRINGEASEKIIREYIGFCTDNAGTFVKCMQTAPRMTRTEDFCNLQMRVMAEQGEKILDCAQNMLKIYKEALKNYCEWTEEKMSVALSGKQGSSSKSRKEGAL